MLKCNRCGKMKEEDQFIGKKNQIIKTCFKCREEVKIRSRCQHNMIGRNCRECDGRAICQHDRIKTACRECKGGSICPHDKQRSKCKDCKGGSICQHNKMRTICRECGGGSYCEHDRRRDVCKECKGGAICLHNKVKTVCRECGGGSYCEHDRLRSKCKECQGGSICPHNKVRTICKDCGGGSICHHNKQRAICKDCKGCAICPHNINRRHCITCSPNKACIICKSVLQQHYKPYCFRCFCSIHPNYERNLNYRTKEIVIMNKVKDEIKEKISYELWLENRTIPNGKSIKRPDLFISMFEYNFILEIDEEQHKRNKSIYGDENEDDRHNQLFIDGGSKPTYIIRFNPDFYIKDGVRYRSCFKRTSDRKLIIREDEFERRMEKLIKKILKYISKPPEVDIKVRYLFYDSE